MENTSSDSMESYFKTRFLISIRKNENCILQKIIPKVIV